MRERRVKVRQRARLACAGSPPAGRCCPSAPRTREAQGRQALQIEVAASHAIATGHGRAAQPRWQLRSSPTAALPHAVGRVAGHVGKLRSQCDASPLAPCCTRGMGPYCRSRGLQCLLRDGQPSDKPYAKDYGGKYKRQLKAARIPTLVCARARLVIWEASVGRLRERFGNANTYRRVQSVSQSVIQSGRP